MNASFVFQIGMVLAGGAAVYLVYAAYRSVRAEGLRPFGFMCDRCTGKFRDDGTPYIRCRIKPRILRLCGVDVDQKELERIEPEWFLG